MNIKERFAIFGTSRVQKDFRYIFDYLDVVCFFTEENESHNDTIDGIPVYAIDDIQNHIEEFDKIILCDFDDTQKEACLKEMGLEYRKNYIFERDMFHLLDVELPENIHRKKIIIWGTGNQARIFTAFHPSLDIAFFLDNNEEVTCFQDYPVKHPAEINDWNSYYIIVANKYYRDIRKQLEGYGLQEKEDFWSSTEVQIPSELLKKTIFDQNYFDLECNTMHNTFEAAADGKASCCCTTFVEQGIGNLINQEFDEIWRSAIHKILCLSTVNRTYTFCRKDRCPLLMEKKPVQNADILPAKYKQMEERPLVTGIGIDTTCNLACGTCREKIIGASGRMLKESLCMAEKFIRDILPSSRFWILAGDGEVFASQVYRKIYTSPESRMPECVRILTNGTLFTEPKWEEFSHNRTGEIMFSVSIDAATQETYEKIRRYGNFEKLRQNMAFASRLRKENKITYLQMNFVVQRMNYKEMIPFVKWCKELGADKVFFTKILNWGTYTPKEFEHISMMEGDMTPKPELKKILEDPIMQDPIVDLGTINWKHNTEDANQAENFYEWEIAQFKET